MDGRLDDCWLNEGRKKQQEGTKDGGKHLICTPRAR